MSDRSKKVLHAGARAVELPRFASVVTVLDEGYVRMTGEAGTPGRLVLYGWDGEKTLLAQWTGTQMGSVAATDREVAWLITDYEDPSGAISDIAGGMLTREGCVTALRWTGVKALPPASDESRLTAQLLGFVAPGDVAVRVRYVGGIEADAAFIVQVLVSSGRRVSWPGVGEDFHADGIVLSAEGRLVAAPDVDTGAPLAYDTDRSRALWANIYAAPEPYFWLPVGFSPSGPREPAAAHPDDEGREAARHQHGLGVPVGGVG